MEPSTGDNFFGTSALDRKSVVLGLGGFLVGGPIVLASAGVLGLAEGIEVGSALVFSGVFAPLAIGYLHAGAKMMAGASSDQESLASMEAFRQTPVGKLLSRINEGLGVLRLPVASLATAVVALPAFLATAAVTGSVLLGAAAASAVGAGAVYGLGQLYRMDDPSMGERLKQRRAERESAPAQVSTVIQPPSSPRPGI